MRIHRPKCYLLNLCAIDIFFFITFLVGFVREGKEIKNFSLNYISYPLLGSFGPLNIRYLILGG